MKLLGIIILFLLSACSVRQEIHFNKDFSGSVKIEIDMSQIFASFPADSAMSLGTDSVFTSFRDMETIEGISNLELKEDNGTGIYLVSYDFEDIKALNRTLKGSKISNRKNDSESIQFKKRGKKLSYFFPELQDTSSSQQATLMDSYINFSIEMSFENTISSVKTKSENVTQKSDGHKVFWNPKYSSLMNKGGNTIDIKLSKR